MGDNMTVRIYVRASTKDQDAERALDDLVAFSKEYGSTNQHYIENESGTKLDRTVLNRLLDEAQQDDILLVESVDRLSRLTQKDFAILKQRIAAKGLRLIVADLPTTHAKFNDDMSGLIMKVINDMLIDLLATMAQLDNDKRKERIKQGMARSPNKPTGKKADTAMHQRIMELVEDNKSKDKAKKMTLEEIAGAVGCKVNTIYRVLRNAKEQEV
jgi:DNA invertase Pin-like site-specific DNA recombinase